MMSNYFLTLPVNVSIQSNAWLFVFGLANSPNHDWNEPLIGLSWVLNRRPPGGAVSAKITQKQDPASGGSLS